MAARPLEETRRHGEAQNRTKGTALFLGGLPQCQTFRSYKELRVYQSAIDAAMQIFELTKRFPADERFSMIDQMRRCSRSVCSNIAEAWRKRRYPAHFASKLSDSEGEGEETRAWLKLAFRCGYISGNEMQQLDSISDGTLA